MIDDEIDGEKARIALGEMPRVREETAQRLFAQHAHVRQFRRRQRVEREQPEHDERAHQAELLADDREDEVGVGRGKVHELELGGAEALAEPAARELRRGSAPDHGVERIRAEPVVVVAVYAGVDPSKAPEATSALLGEMAKLRDQGITDDELFKAKELSKGRLLLRMEDTRNVSGWLGGQEMLNGSVKTPDEVVELIDAVTMDDVRSVAARILRPEQLSVAIVGPFKSDRKFASLAAL